ncbi:MAG: hypothetical protein AAFW84_29895 [Cyanobacteria bacterium J06635_15]
MLESLLAYNPMAVMDGKVDPEADGWITFNSLSTQKRHEYSEALSNCHLRTAAHSLENLMHSLLDLVSMPSSTGAKAFSTLGKSGNFRSRFRSGHKALGWAFLDRLDPDDVRIAVEPLSFQWVRLSLQIEQSIIRALLPPYNIRIVPAE